MGDGGRHRSGRPWCWMLDVAAAAAAVVDVEWLKDEGWSFKNWQVKLVNHKSCDLLRVGSNDLAIFEASSSSSRSLTRSHSNHSNIDNDNGVVHHTTAHLTTTTITYRHPDDDRSSTVATTKTGPNDARRVVWAISKFFFVFLSCFISADCRSRYY